MKIIGIETSCDETAISIIEVKSRQVGVLSNTISSQIKLHAKYGGVVPNLAAREHVKNIRHVFRTSLKEARVKDFKKDIDIIAVTRGPGLGPALLVGIAFARAIAWKYDKPLIGTNHLEGHIYSNWLPPIANPKSRILNPKNIFPVLNLIVSGGHTELVLMRNYGKYKLIGETLDDAIGEAFDKVARLLKLGYPGGPHIAQHAEQYSRTIADSTLKNTEYKLTDYKKVSISPGSGQHKSVLQIEFPRPMIKSKDFNFSYSGLKTAVLYKVRDLTNAGIKINNKIIDEICYEFQKAAVDVILYKTLKAAKEYKVKSIFLSGGVSANKHLRAELEKLAKTNGFNYHQPGMEYTGDNASMIAMAGYFNYKNNPALSRKGGASWKSVEMDANLSF